MKEGRLQQAFSILCWALYDLANQFFALNVVSLYFVCWLVLEKGAPEILYGISFGISTFLVAFFSPIWGQIADETRRYRPFLVYLTLVSVVFTLALGWPKSVSLGLLFFALANFGCQLAIVFYNALMLGISPGHKFGLVSGIGKMCGYCGAILALYLVRPVVAKYGYQATFLPTGLLFFFFSLPCLLFVHDARGEKKKIKASTLFQAKKVFEMVGLLGRIIREGSILSNFLKCSFFGLASVNAVILFMSVYAMRAFGFDKISVIGLITFSTFFAIAGSLLSGLLSDYLGYKRMLAAVFIAWILSFLSGALADNGRSYWIIGALVGATLGSTWVVSRALAMHIAPRDKIGQALGLFNLVGYLSAITGGIFYSLVLWFLKPLGEIGYRISLLSLSVFSVLGFIFLLRIPQVDKNGLKRADHS